MGVSPTRKYLFGIPTALAVASLLNVNPVLAQTVSDRGSGILQTEPENAQPILAESYLNDDSTVPIQLEQLQAALIEAEIELLESEKFSYKAADLLPEGNNTGSIFPTNPTNPTLRSQAIAQSETTRSNSIAPQRWYVQAEALFLNRTIPRGILTSEVVDLSVAETGSPERGGTLRTDDVAFDYELGTRITVGYSRDRKDSISFSFFGLQEYSSSATLVSPEPGLPSDVVVEVPTDDTPILDPSESLGDKINILNQEPPLGLGNGSFAISQAFLLSYEHQLDYSANLYNFEVNYHKEVASSNNFRPSWLVGVRYISAPEKFNLATFGAAAFPEEGLRAYPTGDYNIETRNNLFGFQIGGNANIGVSRNFSIGLGAKAGVFANNGDQSSTISAYDFDTGELLERIKGVKSEWGLSPVVEGSISANWQVTPNVSLTAGFNLVYLYGLALAPRQFRDFAESGEFGRLDMSGDTLYYGPSVGIRVVF
ncbi:BBP7 family outer membrane beta-barrel protein [Planktothrix sp. FACHB-1355]|uniref:BBP7 family outer membrane beta-barrel protein n=1 Tax=Aerosakkonema funiforme FACHB-1375 TaxID=2949571 RepID=A0A926VHG4_9CYAN|nr:MULTISPECIES: Lpg1974 family pore-forming outer membrane protein [Oscillatoriales]MBD2183795.1 BBP7 family outer membrane beta-barrel protein [Aerosakkonema funiforme FACHB-1375]MBD3560152.1 BBP7 family outer membrane beta-barrel protein [Planktothrix sp. FACHB-1355]